MNTQTETLSRKDLENLGIEFIKTPDQPVDAGHFELPADFPKDKYAAHWVPNDQVRMKEQKTTMPGVGASVPGLEVYKGPDGKGKPIVVHLSGDKKFTLMIRPKALQKAMNALYGNVGKSIYNTEVKGETVAGDPQQDSGMLPVSRLSEMGVVSKSEIEESLVTLNRVVEQPTEATIAEV